MFHDLQFNANFRLEAKWLRYYIHALPDISGDIGQDIYTIFSNPSFMYSQPEAKLN